MSNPVGRLVLVPEPLCAHTYDDINEVFTPLFVVFSYTQAAAVFNEAPHKAVILCVDVPRALYVTSCYEAKQFYDRDHVL